MIPARETRAGAFFILWTLTTAAALVNVKADAYWGNAEIPFDNFQCEAVSLSSSLVEFNIRLIS